MASEKKSICFSLSLAENKDEKKNMLSDLGKATKRGIKKCFKCGVYNGTRGFTCKNKQCDAVLRDVEKRKINLDAVKLAETSKQVYSVRVRDKGPDYRGFVQLPLIYSKGEVVRNDVPGYSNEFATITEVAICFVDSCQRLFDDSILKCHEAEEQNCTTVCPHIESAIRSSHMATPLQFKPDLLNLMSISEEMKRRIWDLAKETNGVIAQRASKSVMVVKCQVTPKYPLGYLHLTFLTSKGKDTFDKFICGCAEHKVHGERDELNCCENKCVHFYACLASFACDVKYLEEFKTFINAECQFEPNSIDVDDAIVSELLGIYSNGLTNINSLLEFSNLSNISKTTNTSEDNHKVPSVENNCHLSSLESSESQVRPNSSSSTSYVAASIQYTHCLNALTKITNERINSMPKLSGKVRKGKRGFNDEDVISFTDWLSSITECINETIHCSCSENPEPLVFHIPLRFFELLRERLSSSNSKMRLPNSTERYVRKNQPTVGNLFKYTWHITNVLHIKQMFDTNEVSLKLIKHYIKNKDGDFIECSDVISRAGHKPFIRPSYTSFIKIGLVNKDQKEPIPFVIEWIPNFLRVSNFGELKLIYQIGHQCQF